MLRGKTIVLGVTGSIAAYKMADVASALIKLNADVHVLMTENATNFINPITFETLTSNKCIVDTFDRDFDFDVKHISLAQKADLFMIAPASANVIGKVANGIADDMLTTTLMACECPVLISPAMNTRMYENPILQDNISKLEGYGYKFIEATSGRLACGDTGKGKLPAPEILLDHILREVACEKDMAGLKLLVTAGPTREAIDPVRYITNHSSGKMGYAIARRAMLRGADVTIVSGEVAIAAPPFVDKVDIVSAGDMYEAVLDRYEDMDIIVMAAAVADYKPCNVAQDKIKKSDSNMSIALSRNEDILKYVGNHSKPGQVICGFSMETKDLLENSTKKLLSKKADMIAANNLRAKDAGFKTDNNTLTLITANNVEELDNMSKDDAANILLDRLLAI
ncbi:MAG: bifunctional phosphopantothenoylcysteine decarboxylase/phosphopantothenate--cysteine ligase CoaBC, partial [Bacillota bacterium]|nr:bifunctional phosphopantothenoylcysteine decarboxylase/phosphopantothenate--cysteine ligase CoaBC [Bacillota bacterium]